MSPPQRPVPGLEFLLPIWQFPCSVIETAAEYTEGFITSTPSLQTALSTVTLHTNEIATHLKGKGRQT